MKIDCHFRPHHAILALAAICLSVAPSRGQNVTPITLTSFGQTDTDGFAPAATLIQGSDGSFYGTTYGGGVKSAGTVFKIDSKGNRTTLYNFGTAAGDGANPQAALILGPDGNFYGMTGDAGAHAGGTIFQMQPDGKLTTLHGFGGDSTEGLQPSGGLVLGPDGNFYGTTSRGGTTTYGTVFQFTTAGKLTTLHTFTRVGDDGGSPSTTLTLGRDGSFYGTTYNGGTHGNGTVFVMNLSGGLTTLYSFGSAAGDGANPRAPLVEAGDGSFYGTTLNGGVNGKGTVFQVKGVNALVTLHSFGGASPDGANPWAELTLGRDGNFYGATFGGGAHNLGTIFKMLPAGTLTTIHSFGSTSTEGTAPIAGLVLGSDGNLYGTTYDGGVTPYGTVFQLSTGTTAPGIPTVTLAATTPTVTAGSGQAAVFTVTLSAAQDHDVVVNFTVKGSAENGVDYSLINTTKKIKAGKTSKSIKIIPQGDLGGASKKTVKLTLVGADGYTVGTSDKGKVKILAP